MTPERPLSGHRVLVVEDELMVAMGLELALQDAGCQVVGLVGRFDQALRAAETTTAEVALLDVNLRGTEVYPVADALAARGVAFAFLTGYNRAELPERFASAKVLCKPFRREDILSVVKALAKA